jgi:hypothetical protein
MSPLPTNSLKLDKEADGMDGRDAIVKRERRMRGSSFVKWLAH